MEILGLDISFAEKLRMIMDRKHGIISEISESHFSKYAWEDKALQQIYTEAATTKALYVYTQFIELGKKEGAINEAIPTDAILDYILASVNIMQQPSFLNTSTEYKMGILKLFLYGILGREK